MLAQLGAEITSASWFGTADAAAMAVTDGNFPARLKGCAGISVRLEDAPGGLISLRWPQGRKPEGGLGRAVTGDDGDNDGKASDGADDGDDSGRIWTCARGDARACRPRNVFGAGFAPWVHDRASRLHRAVT